MAELRAQEVMNPHVVSVKMNASIKELVKLFSETEVSGAPVVDDNNKLVGMVTEQDLTVGEQRLHFPPFMHILDGIVFLDGMRHFEADLKHALASDVKDLMTVEVVKVHQDETLDEVIRIINEQDVNRIPVVDDDERLVGIITRADVIKAISK